MGDDGYVKKYMAGKDSHEGMTRRNFLSSLSTGVAATVLMMPTFSSALSKDKTSGSPVLAPDGSFSTEEAFSPNSQNYSPSPP